MFSSSQSITHFKIFDPTFTDTKLSLLFKFKRHFKASHSDFQKLFNMKNSKAYAVLAADMEDFRILFEPYQPGEKKLDTDIPPGHDYEREKGDALRDSHRGKHKDIKVSLANDRAEKEEQQGKKMT